MTESQKAVLNLLKNKDMTAEDLAVELHYDNKRMKRVLTNMVKTGWIEKDEDYLTYTMLIDYSPDTEWSFSGLLGVWK